MSCRILESTPLDPSQDYYRAALLLHAVLLSSSHFLYSSPACLSHTAPRSQQRLPIPTSGPLIGSTVVSPSATVRDLGVFIDQDLAMKTHVQQTASRCFATLRQLRSIRRCIPTSVFHSLVSALVLSRLDYCNSLLVDLPLTHIQRLQSVQNAAARLIFNRRRCDHITCTRSSAFIGSACQSELYSRWRR